MRHKTLLSTLSLVLLLASLIVVLPGAAGAQGPGPQSGVGTQAALGTAFTYQGRLTDGGNLANGTYDFKFILWDAASGGSGVEREVGNVGVESGLFTVQLDFGSDVFKGDARWLQAEVRPGDSTGNYVLLEPRQLLTPTPYAIYAARASSLTAPDGDPANALYVDNDGNIGIGTTSPSAKLDVAGNVEVGGLGTHNMLFFNDDGTGSGDLARISTETSDTALDIVGPGGCPLDDCSNRKINIHNRLHIHGNLTANGSIQTGLAVIKEDNSNYLIFTPSSTAGNNGLFWSSASKPELGYGANTLSLNTLSLPRLTIDQAGNVGIGTTSPSANLDVAGDATVNGNLDVGTLNGTDPAALQIPSGAVMFFNLSSCPSGWSPLPGAAGRYLVGLPAGGALGATVGYALTPQENRPVGRHTHGVVDPGHSHNIDLRDGTWGGGYADDAGSGDDTSDTTTGTSHTNISISEGGSVPGTNAPYMQLLVCQKD